MFDAAIGWMMWVWRQFKDIWAINDIFQTPEQSKAYLDKLWAEWPNLSQEQLNFFMKFHPTLIKSAEKYFELAKTKAISAWDDLILGMDADEFVKQSKRAYASAKVRDLYIKNGWQLTDWDRNLLSNLQKLVDDPNINLASVVKLDWNIPWKVTFAWQTSNVKIKADAFQRSLDWEYEKPVDQVFNWEWWKPDSVMNKQQLETIVDNIKKNSIFKDIDKWVEITNKEWVKEFKPYIKEVEDWYQLTREWYEYLGIVDKRTSVDEIIKTDWALDVADALKIAKDNGADISDKTISLIQNTDLINKLISISWC